MFECDPKFGDFLGKVMSLDFNVPAEMEKFCSKSCASKQEKNAKHSVVEKRIVPSKSVNGSDIELHILTHNDRLCKEFVIKSQKFNFKLWIFWTTLLNIVGYKLQLHVQDFRLMVAVIILLLLVLLVKINLKVKKESLFVMASIGVQLTTTFVSGRTTSMFYDTTEIRSIVINEAITMHQVIYYLTLLLGGCSNSGKITALVPLYMRSWPSINCLRIIRHEALSVLTKTERT